MFELTNKIALVTGGRRGMGKAHALALAKMQKDAMDGMLARAPLKRIGKPEEVSARCHFSRL